MVTIMKIELVFVEISYLPILDVVPSPQNVPKKGLNCQKSPKIEVFSKFLNIRALLFAENLKKVATYGPAHNLYSGYTPKTLVSPPQGLLGLKMAPK